MGQDRSDTIERRGFGPHGARTAPASEPPALPAQRAPGPARPQAVETPHGYHLYL